MRWPWKRKPAPEPLLSEREMKDLHEQIFEEDVSVERLFAIFDAVPREIWGCPREWVMDQHTFNRIRRTAPVHSPIFWSGVADPSFVEQLIGLPIAIEPFAKLGIRCRLDHAHGGVA